MAYTYSVSGFAPPNLYKKNKEKFEKKYGPVQEDFIFEQLKLEDPKATIKIEDVGKCMMSHWLGTCSCKRTGDCALIRAWQAQKVAVEMALSKHRMDQLKISN
jgi:hypothetical protein